MEHKAAKYAVVKQSIKQQIENGTLAVDDRLPTEAEYAKIYQVSTITIRRALTELAKEGYIKRLKHKGTFVTSPVGAESASRLIALILYSEDRNDSSYIHLIRGAQNMASSFHYSLIVEWIDADAVQEAGAIQKMLNLNVEGLLLYSFDPAQSIANYRYLEEKGIPFVLLDRYDPGYPCYFSGCNNYDGGAMAAKLLLEHGHEKILFVGYHFFLKSEQERYDGFCSMMRKAGHNVSEKNLIVDADCDALAARIRAGEVTALFCCNDRLAVKTIRSLRERGLRIPEDVSVMGFDDWAASPDVERELTTIRQDFTEIGSNTAYLLLSRLQRRFVGSPVKILSGVSLVVRKSVCHSPLRLSRASETVSGETEPALQKTDA